MKRLDGRNDMAEFTAPLKDGVTRLKSTTEWLTAEAAKDPNAKGAAAMDYLRLFTLVVYGWMWVLMAEKAIANKNGDAAFYDTKLAVARYFFQRVLPQAAGLDGVVRAGSRTMMALAEAAF